MAHSLKLSATALNRCKRCPTLFRLAHILGIRPDIATEPLRVGTHWHLGQQILTAKAGDFCPICHGKPFDFECPICGLSGKPEDRILTEQNLLNPFHPLVTWIEAAYALVPDNSSAVDWELERDKIIAGLWGWYTYWRDDEIEVLGTEIPFDLPLTDPKSGRPLQVRFVGRIDSLLRRNGLVCIGESKSTSEGVGSDSRIWNRLRRSTQPTGYILAARHLQLNGDLRQYGIAPNDPLISGVLYDVWKKPTLSPKFLGQGETKAFIRTREYYNNIFEIEHRTDGEPEVIVNDVKAEIKLGKNGFAIRETPDMYFYRLMEDITSRPEFYYNRREFARTDAELRAYEWERYHMMRMIQTMKQTGHWYSNELQCEAMGRCEYIPICDNHVVIPDDLEPPTGFKCIFP